MEPNLQITQQKTDNTYEESNEKNNEEHFNEEIRSCKQDPNKNDQCEGEITELLGSVTTLNCPGTRFSARVIQKMKQDQIITPPNDQKKEEKNLQKTPSNIRANKPIWTNLERNHFFDALNEFGKDFEAIGNYINLKLKRKNATDKTNHQVRQHYYQTYHKICKYVKYSDEVKKPVQELYALINYGEMRRKLQFVTDKHFMKLKNLIYQGQITVRCKGKNIRVKTPSCKALRRINQLDDTLEDIRLPSKIEVILTPSNMETFGRLQTIAQNPRVRCMVPLHKKLTNFIRTFQYKWRSTESRLAEEEIKLFSTHMEQNDNIQQNVQEPEICFIPKPGVAIHRPLLSITEHLSSVNICLSAYEDRLGVKVRSESVCQERAMNTKRQRTDSGSEKRSPETKKLKSQLHEKNTDVEILETVKENVTIQTKSESSSDELNDDINAELLSDNDNIVNREEISLNPSNTNEPLILSGQTNLRTKRSLAKSIKGNIGSSFKPLLNAEAIRRIRQGWTISNASDITIGDLYVVLGQDSRLELEYYWTDELGMEKPIPITTTATSTTPLTSQMQKNTNTEHSSIFSQKQSGMPYNPNECDDPNLIKTISSSNIGSKLKHLLLIANLSERIRKRQCSCGHICERNAVKTRIERDFGKTIFSGKPVVAAQALSDSNKSNISFVRNTDGSVFRQPNLPPRRPVFNMDPVKQLTALSGQKTSRQVFVQRVLLPGTITNSQDIENEKHRQSEEILDATNLKKQTQDYTHEDSASTTTIKNTPDHSSQSILCSFAGAVEALTTSDSSVNHNLILPAQHTTPSSTDSAFDDCNSLTSLFNGMSPMHLLRETTSNSRWLEDNLNDFSLTSLLGHLDEINANRDIVDPSNISVISESSVDFMHKFQEISALMQKQEKD